MAVDVSFDKASAMCLPLVEPDAMRLQADGRVVTRHWDEDKPGSSFQWCFSVGSVRFELHLRMAGDKHRPVVCWASDEPVRIEFNPNKVTADELRAVSFLVTRPRWTRLDVALDYFDVDLRDFAWSRDRVKGSWFTGTDAEPEGFYLGRLSSARMLRVYDKADELGVDLGMPLTRCEAVARYRPGVEPLQETAFDGLRVLARDIPRDLSPREAANISMMINAPAHFARLSAPTRRKYTRLAESFCPTLPEVPADVYRERLPVLRKWLRSLTAFEPVPIAEVYKEVAAGGATPTA